MMLLFCFVMLEIFFLGVGGSCFARLDIHVLFKMHKKSFLKIAMLKYLYIFGMHKIKSLSKLVCVQNKFIKQSTVELT